MPSESSAAAGPAASSTAARTRAIRKVILQTPFVAGNGSAALYPEGIVEPGHACGEVGVGDPVPHPAVLHDVVAVGHGGGEAEVLLDEEHGEARILQAADGRADLLDDHRGRALGGLVEGEERGAGAQKAGNRGLWLLAPESLVPWLRRRSLRFGKSPKM